MPKRIAIAHRAWLALAVVALVTGLIAAPRVAFAADPALADAPLSQAAASQDAASCEDDGAPQATLCLLFDDDDLPPGLCAEDGSARVAPAPSLPVAPDTIEGPPRCPLAVVLRADAGRNQQREPSAPVPAPELADPATIPDPAIPLPFGAIETALDTPYRGAGADGVAFELERPPTAPR
jgi:hypothetical protein